MGAILTVHSKKYFILKNILTGNCFRSAYQCSPVEDSIPTKAITVLLPVFDEYANTPAIMK